MTSPRARRPRRRLRRGRGAGPGPSDTVRGHRHGPARRAGSCPTRPTSTSSSSTTGHSPPTSRPRTATANALVDEISATTAEGQTFRVDANLRPEGKDGPLARSLDGYRTYYERWALTWELQALLRARPVAGDPDLGKRFLDLVEPYVYRDPFPDDAARDVRRIKARVERERIPPGQDPSSTSSSAGAPSPTSSSRCSSSSSSTAPRTPLGSGGRGDGRHVASARSGRAAPRRRRRRPRLEAYTFCEHAPERVLPDHRAPVRLPPGGGRDAAHVSRLLGCIHRPEATLRDEFGASPAGLDRVHRARLLCTFRVISAVGGVKNA